MRHTIIDWVRGHRRLLTLLAVLLALLFNVPKLNQAMEGMINGYSDGYHGQPDRRDAGG